MILMIKKILRKESFGGILAVPETGALKFLDHEAYNKQLESGIDNFKHVDISNHGFVLPEDALASPLYLYLEVTKNCNGYCTQCYMDAGNNQNRKNEIQLGELKNLIKDFSDKGGYYLRLTGGEPTVRPDFLQIVRYAVEQGLRLGINTNGYFTPDYLNKIITENVKDIRISIEGPEPVNDAIRGKGSFRKAFAVLEGVHEANKSLDDPVDLTINVVLMKSTISSLDKVVELAVPLGAKVSFGLLRPTGRADQNQMLTPEEIVKAASRIQTIRKGWGLGQDRVRINFDIFQDKMVDNKFRPFPFDYSRCPMATIGISVDAYGHIFPCGYMVNIPGWKGAKVQEHDLLSLWHNSELLKKARAATRKDCTGCNYYKTSCNGGCPIMSFITNGSLSGPDPYCVRDEALLQEQLIHAGVSNE